MTWGRLGWLVGRAVLPYVAAALLSLPLATAWALTHTEVRDTIGVSPTTFSLTTRGHSELRLGIAGTVYVPRSAGPLGMVATVDGPLEPSDGGADLASYVRPDLLQLYSGLFHDPGPAVRGYVDVLVDRFRHELLVAELWSTLLLGTAVVLVTRLWPASTARSRRPRLRLVATAGVALVATTTLGVLQVVRADAGRPTTGAYTLTALAGTQAAGATTNSPVLSLLLGSAVPKVEKLVSRQEQRVRDYQAAGTQGLEQQAAAMEGPRPGEVAVLMQSDMHCSQTMIDLQARVRTMLGERYGAGVPALMAVTGDLTTNGTAAEGTCIQREAAIAGDAPVAAVTGNHESDLSARQMAKAGMEVLDGSTTEVGGVEVLGDGDPERSELFGATERRGEETETDLGRRLFEEAGQHRPDLVLVHEAYAAQAFLGVDDAVAFLERRTSPTEPREDEVRDLPAGAVFYGHWHRSVEPRVVWNSDGTWTLVMELDTSGGAVDTPTIGHFSTPWTPPQQEASFPVVFLDEETGLVTGYQVYSFATDGTASVRPRVDVGRVTGTASR
jgi:Calcineurin-like phosphoesterase